ncbi:MAG: peptidoglycan-binding protein [Clostridiales bacterium]|nr:peptidoglycan-binding protein [Clostridiales bacterium]
MRISIRLLAALLAVMTCISCIAFSETTYTQLSEGMQGDDVLKLQNKLASMYYNPGKANGTYTEQTKWAVASFQKLNGLEVTGVADPHTLEVLYSASAVAAPSPAPTPVPTPKPTKKPEPSLLSASDCKYIAEGYVYSRYGFVSIIMEDVDTDNKYAYVAITYSTGAWSYGAVVVVVDRKTGSVVSTRSAHT